MNENEKTKGWWDTEIIDVNPNEIVISGYRIEELMGRINYAEMLHLMITGRLPSETTGRLMDAVLVAACDQGAISPAIAVSCMAATCGVTFNSAVASGMNLLGKIHGGAIEDAMAIFYRVIDRSRNENKDAKEVVREICQELRREKRFLPGYGHPVHKEDPRTTRLWEMAEQAVLAGQISGEYIVVARSFYEVMKEITGKHLTINIDASAAAILCELGIPSEIASGFICLSRGLGLVAHAHEELERGKRLKAPMPPDLLGRHMTYSGPEMRQLPIERTQRK